MTSNKPVVGWREWVQLPELGIDAIKAKVDTGAKTCALHAFYIELYKKNGEDWVRFGMHPYQDDTDTTIECHARLVDQRSVTNSGGYAENRYVITTPLVVGGNTFEAEITLTNRESMRFRMLLGRNALDNRFVVDSAQSYLLGSSHLNTQESNDEDCNTIEE